LKIAVCLKRVPDTESRFTIAPDRVSVDTAGLKFDMSDFDGYALELALRLNEQQGGGPGEIVVLDKVESKDGKTKGLKESFGKLDLTNALIIDGAEIEPAFARAARNIPNIDVLPVQGINVYDILRRKSLVLTKAAVAALEARFK